MQQLRVQLTLRSALGTPMRGDTLFGQLCWTLAQRHGVGRLEALLQGYTSGRPFMVVSDAMPFGFVPRPAVPPPPVNQEAQTEAWAHRKAWMQRAWIPEEALQSPLIQAYRASGLERPAEPQAWLQPHNSIRRSSGTTGPSAFAPFQSPVQDPAGGPSQILRTLFDPDRIDAAEVSGALADIGLTGFGRDASTGLGRFTVDSVVEEPPPPAGDTVVTLAPCAIPEGAIDPRDSYWRTFTRFGRHGGAAALANPFKRPVLLADTGACLKLTKATAIGWLGMGLGGDGRLSSVIPGAVHQAYTPLLPVDLGGWHG